MGECAVRIAHNGDGGDCIAALAVIRQLGGGTLVLTQGPNQRPFEAIGRMLIPLAKAQPYIDDCVWDHAPKHCGYELINWRKPCYKPNRTLAESQAEYLGVEGLDLSPWIKVESDPRSLGKIIIARTKRYNNPSFPWRIILNKYRTQVLFVGLDEERYQLERMVGWSIPHIRVQNFLEMAKIIAGSRCLIANQSSPGWLAMAMGHPIIQETENTRKIHDSRVFRENAIFWVGGTFPTELPHKVSWPEPGGWFWEI